MPRPYLERLYPLVSQREVHRAVVLMGPRRVGKTVLLHQAIDRLIRDGTAPHHTCYVSVDQPLYNGLGLDRLLEAYAAAADVVLESDPCFVFFDEIQYLKDWEVHLKSLVDRYPNVRFVVSGSAAAALKMKSTESGAGRFTDFLLPPLTFHEYLTLLGLGEIVRHREARDGFVVDVETEDIDGFNDLFVRYLNFGGYPEVALSSAIQRDPARYVKNDIVDKVLLRDLPSLYGVQDVQELNYLFTTLAYNTAGEVSLEQLSKGSGVAKNTIKRYIDYLEAAFLIRVVHRVDRNARRFKRANFFKVYLTNPSIRTALFSRVDADDEAVGSLVETAIFAQWFRSDLDPYYARWSSGEVDLVAFDAAKRIEWAMEAKWSDRAVTRPAELGPLLSFCKGKSVARAIVTTRTVQDELERDGVTVRFVPAALYCYAVGHDLVVTSR